MLTEAEANQKKKINKRAEKKTKKKTPEGVL